MVLLDAYSEAEKRNAQVWEHLGYGISLSAWRASGYSLAALDQLHRNILARRAAVDYPLAFGQRSAQEVAA